MKRIIFFVGLFMSVTVSFAQNSYIVKTRGAKKATVVANVNDSASEENEKPDFVTENFKHYSLCDWQEGMKFMVMPGKYDLIVNTFVDSITGKEVSSSGLREKIMIYKGHVETSQGRCHLNFLCQDNNKYYYYEIPNGTFEDYCESKMGVPTLAYLGDVDIARTKLMSATLYTLADIYRVDNDASADGYNEITIPKNTEVKVVAIGVGTRSFPVKIIVEDKSHKEFYQCVAMSRTNSGMRDDEFIMDNTKFLFNGSFQMADANVTASGQYTKYINRHVYTRRSTKMDGKNGVVEVLRMTEFVIKNIQSQSNTNYVKMTLQAVKTGLKFTKNVTFVNDNVAGDIDGYHEDYFFELFKEGSLNPRSKSISDAISRNRAIVGMNKSEVKEAKGEPVSYYDENKTGGVIWAYQDGTIVKFSKKGKVVRVEKHK
jgi:hypothetical protein